MKHYKTAVHLGIIAVLCGIGIAFDPAAMCAAVFWGMLAVGEAVRKTAYLWHEYAKAMRVESRKPREERIEAFLQKRAG